MDRSVKGAAALAAAVAILAGGAASASASAVTPKVCAIKGQAALVKLSDQPLGVGSPSCSQGTSN